MTTEKQHGYWWCNEHDAEGTFLHLNALNDSVCLVDLFEVHSRKSAEALGVPAVLLDAYEAAGGAYAEYGNPKDTYLNHGGVVDQDRVARLAAAIGVEADADFITKHFGSADGTPSFARWLDHTDLIGHGENGEEPSDAEFSKWCGPEPGYGRGVAGGC